jgi:hypothetical protein
MSYLLLFKYVDLFTRWKDVTVAFLLFQKKKFWGMLVKCIEKWITIGRQPSNSRSFQNTLPYSSCIISTEYSELVLVNPFEVYFTFRIRSF